MNAGKLATFFKTVVLNLFSLLVPPEHEQSRLAPPVEIHEMSQDIFISVPGRGGSEGCPLRDGENFEKLEAQRGYFLIHETLKTTVNSLLGPSIYCCIFLCGGPLSTVNLGIAFLKTL